MIDPEAGQVRFLDYAVSWINDHVLKLRTSLRHTGNTMAAAQGASLRELMERMGHFSSRAALIYLHATRVEADGA